MNPEENTNQMETLDKGQMQTRIAEIKPILKTLEWDLSKDQLNPGKMKYYQELKTEHSELLEKLNQVQNEDNK